MAQTKEVDRTATQADLPKKYKPVGIQAITAASQCKTEKSRAPSPNRFAFSKL
ncbi:MAG: hypothetical protein HWE23_03560 [Rhodobacteraceae bacterium]|nr:hypothetical protein [Paracoccaceae bacterium]